MERHTAVMGLTMLLSGGLWKTLGLWIKKVVSAVGGAQWASLVGAWKTVVLGSRWTMEAQAREVSEGKNLSDYSCDILA